MHVLYPKPRVLTLTFNLARGRDALEVGGVVNALVGMYMTNFEVFCPLGVIVFGCVPTGSIVPEVAANMRKQQQQPLTTPSTSIDLCRRPPVQFCSSTSPSRTLKTWTDLGFAPAFCYKNEIKKRKVLTTGVDVLTLTATPIPRTLHMSLTGIRDLSTIFSPPANRQNVTTYIMKGTDEIVQRAITRELARGGQVCVRTLCVWRRCPLPTRSRSWSRFLSRPVGA